MHHPHDRQCQVDLIPSTNPPPPTRSTQVDIFNPALDLFPTFGQLQGFDAVVNPGDVLYIPSYWFHHVVSLDESVSVTFWFKAGPSPNLSFPLNPVQRAALRRNLEDLVAKAVGHPKVGEFLAAMRDNTDADVPNFAQNADAVRVLLGKVGITEPADQHQFLADWVNVRFSVCAQGGAAKNS